MASTEILGKVVGNVLRRSLEKVGIRNSYNDAFFQRVRQGSINSADRIVPIISDLVKPTSVADVGCGEAFWLASFIRNGVSDVLGVDGDYVDRSKLGIPADKFFAHDLNTPLKLPRRFDLAMSVECGEHIRPENSGTFVDSMIGLAPVVMFSAAVPFQGGRDHFNERWIDFWIRLFDQRGYQAVDAIRAQVWNDPSVEWWYRQNIMVFVDRSATGRYPALMEAGRRLAFPEPVVIHPECYLQGVEWGWSRAKSYTTTYPGRKD